MAVPMKLVPENWAKSLNKVRTPTEPDNNNKIITHEQKANGESRIGIITDLPEKYQSKAHALLEGLKNVGVMITETNRIKYPDGTIGSNIDDMLKYIFSMDQKHPRPLDSETFINLAAEVGQPLVISDVDKKYINNGSIKEKPWKSF